MTAPSPVLQPPCVHPVVDSFTLLAGGLTGIGTVLKEARKGEKQEKPLRTVRIIGLYPRVMRGLSLLTRK